MKTGLCAAATAVAENLLTPVSEKVIGIAGGTNTVQRGMGILKVVKKMAAGVDAAAKGGAVGLGSSPA